ncbi:alpha/beta hydrolase fold domain-containing protein [Paenibacillus sp. NPDC055715]
MNLKRVSFLSLVLTGSMIATSLSSSAFAAESKILEVNKTKTAVQLISNVVYDQPALAMSSHSLLRMDILKPDSKGPLPTVVFVTGGGFVSANKDSYLQQRMALSEAGYIVASIEYRVVPDVTFPAPLEDVKSAIRFLRANADRYGVDKEHIAVMGESAGGYLAAMTGTTNGLKEFDKGDHLDQSSSVQAAIDIYGLSDLTKVGEGFSQEVQEKHKSPSATEALWVNGTAVFGRGGSILDHPEAAAAANPISYVTKDDPPFLIMHGDQDTLVSPNQTEILHNALVEKGVDSTRYVVKGAAHGGDYWLQPEVTQVMIDFLNKHFKK